MGIGEKLRKRRQDLNLSRNQLAEKIHVTSSAIANYENGISYPKPDILISLILALEVDANYLYQDYLSNSTLRALYGQELTADEIESVRKYRVLSERSKRLIHLIINEEYERSREEEFLEYVCLQPGTRRLHSGFLLEEKKQRIKIQKKWQLPGMEFCFQIQIDRYEPVFRKYDMLALQHAPAEHNEMGIFCLNGIYYIRVLYKQGGICRLRALNVIEPDIDVLPTDSLVCIGKILGQIYGTYEIVGSEPPEQ